MSQENYDAGFAAGQLDMQAKADKVIKEIGVAGEAFIDEAYDEGYKEGVKDSIQIVTELTKENSIISDKLRLCLIDALQINVKEGTEDGDIFKVLAAKGLIKQLEIAGEK